MPNIRNQALTAIMIEEAIPNCVVEGIDYTNMDLEDNSDDSNLPKFIKNS